jgi:hypothetical protein
MTPLDRQSEAALLEQLHALRDVEAQVRPPQRLEAAVLAAWDTAHPPAMAVRTSAAIWRAAGAVAAGTLLAVSMTLLGDRLRTGAPAAGTSADATLVLLGEPILPGEPVRIVRVRMPASALPSLGMRTVTGDLTETVDVDVLVGEDGVARAIKVGM